MAVTHDYSFLLAKKRVESYRHQDVVMQQHAEAMECWKCEEFLGAGIEAYEWLQRADLALREAAKEGLDVPKDAVQAMGVLYAAWLEPCDRAEKMISQQEQRNFSVSNLEAFRRACDAVRKEVQRDQMDDTLEEAFRGEFFDEHFWQEANGKRSV